MIFHPDDSASIASIVEHYVVRLYGPIGVPAYLQWPAICASESQSRSGAHTGQPARRARWSPSQPRATDRCCWRASSHLTQIIRGADDALVPVAAGRDLHAEIEGAAIDAIDGVASVAARFAAPAAGPRQPACAPAN
jgi:hypothetical protein